MLLDLGVALGEGRPPEEVQQTDARLIQLVEQLDKEEQAEIVPVAQEIHMRALQYLGE